MSHQPPVVLASRSRYRQALLRRLVPAFATDAADVDERPVPGEKPAELALRLAALKSSLVQSRHRKAVVIGSDQVASLDDSPLGKPGSVERAVDQLLACAGREVRFYTAVSVHHGTHRLTHLDTTLCRFRAFDRALAERYVAADSPLDCAGSFKIESRGVILFEAVESHDPTALEGLPLIWLAGALRELGVPLL